MRRSSIMLKVAGIQVAVVLLVMSLFGVWLVYRYSNSEKETFLNETERQTYQLAIAVSSPIWNFSEAGVNDIIDSYMETPSISGISLSDGQSINIEVQKKENGGILNQKPVFPEEANILLIEKPVLYEEQEIGNVSVWFSFDGTRNSIKSYTVQIFIQTLLLVIILSCAVAIVVRHLVSIPITNVRGQVAHLSEGEADLTARLSASSKDEIGELAEGVNRFTGSLQSMIAVIQNQIVDLNNQAESIVSSTEEASSAMNEIAVSISKSNTSVDLLKNNIDTSTIAAHSAMDALSDVNKTLRVYVDNFQETSVATEEMDAQARSIDETAKNKAGLVVDLENIVTETRNVLQNIRTDITELSNRTDSILNTTNLISSLSSQTNLLSMNAAIEAAHAGSHGQGFAVVAEEIRKLATNSAENAKAIRQSMNVNVDFIQRISQNFIEGEAAFDTMIKRAREMSLAFAEIQETVSELTIAIGEITGAVVKGFDTVSEVDTELNNVTKRVAEIVTSNEQDLNISSEFSNAFSEINHGTVEINNAITTLHEEIRQLFERVNTIGKQVGRFHT